jgi:hypothetical protein
VTKEPFERTNEIDKPGIVGARWWQDSLSTADPIARRDALKKLLLVGGAVAGVGVLMTMCRACGSSSGSSDDERTENRTSIDMQREYGWSFGATTEALTFNGERQEAYDPSALSRLSDDLSPAQALLRPYANPTLFQAPIALPKSQIPEEQVKPLREVLKPIFTPAMDAAYRRGVALASVLDAPQHTDKALIVDLPGPEAVAFAAGLARRFEPVFLFDNWPHPRGVVPSHLTLAAAAYYQPLFVRMKTARRPGAPAAFVLDRARLTPYTDDKTQFDNRYIAKLPPPEGLAGLFAKKVLYVAPTSSDSLELDDLNADLVGFQAAGLDVKMIAATDFLPDASVASAAPAGTSPDEWPPYYYGGSPDTHLAIYKNYGWGAPSRPVKSVPSNVSSGFSYRPVARPTIFSAAESATGKATKQKPATFGTVPVVVAAATGLILGAALSRRNGSIGRGGGWFGGG